MERLFSEGKKQSSGHCEKQVRLAIVKLNVTQAAQARFVWEHTSFKADFKVVDITQWQMEVK